MSSSSLPDRPRPAQSRRRGLALFEFAGYALNVLAASITIFLAFPFLLKWTGWYTGLAVLSVQAALGSTIAIRLLRVDGTPDPNVSTKAETREKP